MPTNTQIFDYSKWNSQLGELSKKYQETPPYPHIVLENFLNPRVLDACITEFNKLNETDGWIFERGRELTFSPDTGELLSDQPFASKSEAQFKEKPELMLLIDQRPIDLSLRQLRELIDYLTAEHSPKVVSYAVRYFGLIADTR